MNTIGNANNIRWGYFDVISQATGTGYNIIKVPEKTNENTLYIPIANSLYMEEYQLEDLVNFLYHESNYFNNLSSGKKITHPSTLWYLERENCLAINYPSVITTRLKKTVTQMAFEPTRIPDVNTKGLYYNMMGINPGHNTDIQDAFATTGERHSETFCLIKCLISSSYIDYRTFCKAKDSSGHDVYLINWDVPIEKPNPDPNAFIDCNVGPVFHLDTNKECDHQFCTHYMSTQQGIGSGTREPDTTNDYAAYPPYMVFGKKVGNTGELAVSVQPRGTNMHLKYSDARYIIYFMKYDATNALSVSKNCQWATHIHFNPKIGGIRAINTPILNKKFKLYYLGDPTNSSNALLFHSSFIDLEDNTTKYEVLTGSEDKLLGSLGQDPAIVNKFEGDITYAQPVSDPFGIPQGKAFRFLMLTNGFLHGKKLWKYQSTIPTDFLTIYQSGSLYHSFTNPNNLILTTGDLFEIREEIPMTICSFGPCGENATDPVKATTINTGYRHIYMAIEIKRDTNAWRVANNYNYSMECIFGPYGAFNSAQNGHDFYFVKCFDLNKLENEFGYIVDIKAMYQNASQSVGAIGKSANGEDIAIMHAKNDGTYVRSINKNGYKNYSKSSAISSVIGIKCYDGTLSYNYFSKYTVFGGSWSDEDSSAFTLPLIDNIFGAGLIVPVSIEVYLNKV